ncbi:HNH endonuclease [Roseateles microcysteis]|uniref:HNH endonuclease n=1 Tax=Roseateles microcysteis TaxID=3119057 RepID=UPI002FE5996F
MKQLQRLLFLQGNRCFFCDLQIPEGEASVEHLDALSNGGEKLDENCVVCCKTVNAALGNLSVKEKFRAVLRHKGGFTCPRQAGTVAPAAGGASAEASDYAAEHLGTVLENLQKRGNKRPKGIATLRNVIAALLPEAAPEGIDAILDLLREGTYIAEEGKSVCYPRL